MLMHTLSAITESLDQVC